MGRVVAFSRSIPILVETTSNLHDLPQTVLLAPLLDQFNCLAISPAPRQTCPRPSHYEEVALRLLISGSMTSDRFIEVWTQYNAVRPDRRITGRSGAAFAIPSDLLGLRGTDLSLFVDTTPFWRGQRLLVRAVRQAQNVQNRKNPVTSPTSRKCSAVRLVRGEKPRRFFRSVTRGWGGKPEAPISLDLFLLF
jgi:hypothetical protein